jgi:hypothetical protein
MPIDSSDKVEATSKFWGAIKTFFEDLATLDVVTMTGDIKLEIEDLTRFDDIITKLHSKGSDVHTLAVSHHELDYDAAVFVKNSLSESEKELLEMHMETVKAAQEMRNKVVELAMNALKLVG